MILTIWRHGHAEEGAIDRLREISDTGRDDVGFGSHQFHVACTARSIPHPHQILHSPLVRTTQTADIIAASFARAAVAAENALQPGSRVAAVDAAVSALVGDDLREQHMLLVSHQPLVSRLVEHYLGAGSSVPFLTPGGLVTLSLDHIAPACGQLLFWALPPDYEVGV